MPISFEKQQWPGRDSPLNLQQSRLLTQIKEELEHVLNSHEVPPQLNMYNWSITKVRLYVISDFASLQAANSVSSSTALLVANRKYLCRQVDASRPWQSTECGRCKHVDSDALCESFLHSWWLPLHRRLSLACWKPIKHPCPDYSSIV